MPPTSAPPQPLPHRHCRFAMLHLRPSLPEQGPSPGNRILSKLIEALRQPSPSGRYQSPGLPWLVRAKQCNLHVRGTSWEIGIDMCAGAEIPCKWGEPKAEELKGLGKAMITTCERAPRHAKRRARKPRDSNTTRGSAKAESWNNDGNHGPNVTAHSGSAATVHCFESHLKAKPPPY